MDNEVKPLVVFFMWTVKDAYLYTILRSVIALGDQADYVVIEDPEHFARFKSHSHHVKRYRRGLQGIEMLLYKRSDCNQEGGSVLQRCEPSKVSKSSRICAWKRKFFDLVTWICLQLDKFWQIKKLFWVAFWSRSFWFSWYWINEATVDNLLSVCDNDVAKYFAEGEFFIKICASVRVWQAHHQYTAQAIPFNTLESYGTFCFHSCSIVKQNS